MDWSGTLSKHKLGVEQIFLFFSPQISTVSNGDVIKVVEDISLLQRIQGNHGVWLEEMKKVLENIFNIKKKYYWH